MDVEPSVGSAAGFGVSLGRSVEVGADSSADSLGVGRSDGVAVMLGVADGVRVRVALGLGKAPFGDGVADGVALTPGA